MMSVSLSTDIVFDSRYLNKEIEKQLTKTARLGKTKITDSIREPSSGREHRKWDKYQKRSRWYMASEEYKPPNMFTGDLVKSIQTGHNRIKKGKKTEYELYAGSDREYAGSLEYGGTGFKGVPIAPRPFLQPGIDYAWEKENVKQNIHEILVEAFDNEKRKEAAKSGKRKMPRRTKAKKRSRGKSAITADPIKNVIESAWGSGSYKYNKNSDTFTIFGPMPKEGLHIRKMKSGKKLLVKNRHGSGRGDFAPFGRTASNKIRTSMPSHGLNMSAKTMATKPKQATGAMRSKWKREAKKNVR